jgi:hypothetical protein
MLFFAGRGVDFRQLSQQVPQAAMPTLPGEVDFVEQPDHRHTTIFMGVKSIAPMPTDETAVEEEALPRLPIYRSDHRLLRISRLTTTKQRDLNLSTWALFYLLPQFPIVTLAPS